MKKSADKKTIGEGHAYTKIRRLTGYLAGTLDSFNDTRHMNSNKSSSSIGAKHY